MLTDDDLFNNHTVKRKTRDRFIYILIFGTTKRHSITSFRIESLTTDSISILYHTGWEVYAPLIIEYVVNTWHVKNIALENVYRVT